MENRLEREIAYSADFFQSQVPRTKRYLVYYRVWLVVRHQGWVDIDLSHSTVCLVLLGQKGVWLNWMDRWAKWWSVKIKVNPTLCQTISPTLYISHETELVRGSLTSTFGCDCECECASLVSIVRNPTLLLEPHTHRSSSEQSLFSFILQISAVTPLRLLLERPRARVDFCERPLKPITKFETSVIDVIRCVKDRRTDIEDRERSKLVILFYRVVQLNFALEIEVIHMLFDSCLNIFSMTSLKQQIEYFRCKIKLDLSVHTL